MADLAPRHRDDAARVAKRITALRKVRGLSAAALGECAGLSRNVLASLECGRRGGGLSLAEALALADALDVTLARLLDPTPIEVVPGTPEVVQVIPARPAVTV